MNTVKALEEGHHLRVLKDRGGRKEDSNLRGRKEDSNLRALKDKGNRI